MHVSTARRRAAVVAATGFIEIAGFQQMLALGLPWGRATWGGGQATLPPDLRVAIVGVDL